jgi:hypothetical protein
MVGYCYQIENSLRSNIPDILVSDIQWFNCFFSFMPMRIINWKLQLVHICMQFYKKKKRGYIWALLREKKIIYIFFHGASANPIKVQNYWSQMCWKKRFYNTIYIYIGQELNPSPYIKNVGMIITRAGGNK